MLATIAYPTYQNVLEDSKSKVCKTNLEVLTGAVDAYTLEKNLMPATLSELPDKDIRYAWDRVMKKAGWQVKLAYFIVDIQESGLAYAQTWLSKFAGARWQNLKCPKAAAGENSYGVYKPAGGPLTLAQYRSWAASPGLNVPVVADCNAAGTTFSAVDELTDRHKHYGTGAVKPYAIGLLPGNQQLNCTAADSGGKVSYCSPYPVN